MITNYDLEHNTNVHKELGSLFIGTMKQEILPLLMGMIFICIFVYFIWIALLEILPNFTLNNYAYLYLKKVSPA